MANGAEPVRGGCLTHTVYIWPSPALVARSQQWPQSWHEAFEQAANEIGHTVASYVLGGLPVSTRPVLAELPSGSIGFRVTCRGTSIYIAVSEFEGPDGPDTPGPGSGTRRQHGAADGLVLGLRGTGSSFAVVTFYGRRPAVPAATADRPRVPGAVLWSRRTASLGRHPEGQPATPCTTAAGHGPAAPAGTARPTADYRYRSHANMQHAASDPRLHKSIPTCPDSDSANRFPAGNTDYLPIHCPRSAPGLSLYSVSWPQAHGHPRRHLPLSHLI
jgi:hypothetical protein